MGIGSFQPSPCQSNRASLQAFWLDPVGSNTYEALMVGCPTICGCWDVFNVLHCILHICFHLQIFFPILSLKVESVTSLCSLAEYAAWKIWVQVAPLLQKAANPEQSHYCNICGHLRSFCVYHHQFLLHTSWRVLAKRQASLPFRSRCCQVIITLEMWSVPSLKINQQ